LKRSTDRILTTHVGSLIRPPEVREFLRAINRGEVIDETAQTRVLRDAVSQVVKQQVETGIDIVSDGEFGKTISWSQYVLERLGGFERRLLADDAQDPFAAGEDRRRFPEFYAELDAQEKRVSGGDGGAVKSESVCVGPITYTGQGALQRDIEHIKSAIADVDVKDAFLPVVAPASAIPDRRNEYYASDEECVFALAAAMKVEYRAIVDAGLLVQVDDARAAVTYDRMVPPASFEDYRSWLTMHMEALNFALEGIPEDRVRYHVCWGSWPGPHTSDVALKEIVDLILSVRAGAYVLEGANPRHEHEWRVWEAATLPEDKILIPGVISHGTNVVEHPDLVAERLVRLARIVGRESIIAGTDCGFAQGPFHQRVHPSVMWAKLQALVDGAKLASEALWG
jgi:5-methyltetrahydropteroyltriglutamate--homocysteine methyltransferase